MKNLHCQKCGGDCKLVYKLFIGKSELGFQTKEHVYICQNCGEEHIICPNCNGEGFESSYDPQDCKECNGMGLIETERLKYV